MLEHTEGPPRRRQDIQWVQYKFYLVGILKKWDILWTVNKSFFCHENHANRLPFFIEIVQVYKDMKASSFKAIAKFASLVILVPLNGSESFCKLGLNYCLSLLSLLCVAPPEACIDAEYTHTETKQSDPSLSAVLPLFDELLPASSRGVTEVTQEIFIKAMHRNIGSLNENARQNFPLSICAKPWTCYSTIALYCWSTSERKKCSVWNTVGHFIPVFDVWCI